MWGAETDGPAEGLLSNRKSELTDPTNVETLTQFPLLSKPHLLHNIPGK